MSFWEMQTLQIIMFHSAITSHLCYFLHFCIVKAFGSFVLHWAAELATSEADLDDGAVSGALATVTGKIPYEAALATVTNKIPYEALTGNDELTSELPTTVTDEDKILSELLTVEGLLSESPTFSELLTNEELESQNPSGF